MQNVSTDTSRILDVIKRLEETLPPIFARKAVPKLLGNAIAAGTLANLGKNGPPYFFVGRNAVYDRKLFLDWLKTHINGIE